MYNTQHGRSYQNLQRKADYIFDDLPSKIRRHKREKEEINKEEKELEECTFKPNVGVVKKPPSKPTDKIPKGYYEQIQRMRRITEEKRIQEEKQKKKEVGENYEKLKQMAIKPPSFLDAERKKKKLLMYVDVNITPTKTGRIGIYEGDKVKDLARNF